MLITAALRKYAEESLSVKAGASEADVRKSVADAMMAGTLAPAKLAELSKPDANPAADRVKSMIDDAVGEALTKALSPLFDRLAPPANPGQPATPPAGQPAGTKAHDLTSPAASAAPAPGAGAGEPDPMKAYAAAAQSGAGMSDDVRVRVKSAVERYSDVRTTATWDKSTNPELQKRFGGQNVAKHFCDHHGGKGLPYTLDMPSDRMKAIAGAWLKETSRRALQAQGIPIRSEWQPSEHEQQLILHSLHDSGFVGFSDNPASPELHGEKLTTDFMRKSVLDDSTSGGVNAVPIEFDAVAVLTPLLNGELFPYVSITNVTRRQIQAAAIGNPTMDWGVSEGTAISLFNTDSYVSAFNNNIYPVTGAIELGLDFLADSPIAVGSIVQDRYGERFKQEMDNVIATGNGTNQPEGIFTKSGVSVVTPAGGNGAAPQIGDYEGLMFGVGKEYLQEAGMPPNSRAVFMGTLTSYSRARSINVGTTDARRVYGMDEMSYRLHDFRYAINASLTNAQIAFACLNRYRMYRRQGYEVMVVRGTDWTLTRQNKMGIAVRARFGGALELAAAAAKITGGQA